MIEDASLDSARMLVEAGVRPYRVVGNAKQKIKTTLELTVSKMINSVHGIPRRVSLPLLLTIRRIRMRGPQVTPSDLPVV